jgi:hypothetical protein
MKNVLCLLGVLPLLAGAQAVEADAPPAMRHCQVVFDNGASLAAVPLAETSEQQMRGLSRRHDVRSGMWFAFAAPQPLRFWMRDTWQPLSIGFIDEAGVIFQIADMQPETLDVHAASRPGVAALELPQGRFAVLGVQAGSKVVLQGCQ